MKYPCGCLYKKTVGQIKAGVGVSCSKCEGRVKNFAITEEMVNDRLKNGVYGSYIVSGKYRGVSNWTDVMCLDCNHNHVNVKPSEILRKVTGCEICGGNTKSVKERFMKQLLSDLGVKFETEKTFEGLVSSNGVKLRVDVYLPDYRVAIEYDGGHHDSMISQMERDAMKDEYFRSSDIKLVRIHHLNTESLTLTVLRVLKILT